MRCPHCLNEIKVEAATFKKAKRLKKLLTEINENVSCQHLFLSLKKKGLYNLSRKTFTRDLKRLENENFVKCTIVFFGSVRKSYVERIN